MTLDELIAALQQVRAMRGSNPDAHNGDVEVFYDPGPLGVLRPIGRARLSFDARTKAAEVWLGA